MSRGSARSISPSKAVSEEECPEISCAGEERILYIMSYSPTLAAVASC